MNISQLCNHTPKRTFFVPCLPLNKVWFGNIALLNGPSDRRPPGINGQFLCALTYSPNKWPPARRGQQICAEKPLVTSDGRPVTVANILINSCKNDAMSLFISRSTFLYSVHYAYRFYCLH